jgi:merR family transcriptional regulator protein
MEINLPDKLYYSIGEVAKGFGVNTSLIRFWEKEFAIISPRKSTTGSRKFTPEDVKKLQLIYHLVKEKGFTLEGARQRLKEENQKTLSNYDLISKLQHIKQTLIAIKNALD